MARRILPRPGRCIINTLVVNYKDYSKEFHQQCVNAQKEESDRTPPFDIEAGLLQDQLKTVLNEIQIRMCDILRC